MKIGIESIDVVIHAGAYVPKDNNQRLNLILNHSTVTNTYHLLNNLPKTPKKIILCSSASIYGMTPVEKAPVITEDLPVNIDNEYNLAKYCSELIVRDYAITRGTSYEILRFGLVYGIGDGQVNFLISTWLSLAAQGKDIVLNGDPKTKRNLIYVDDLCRFILRAIDCPEDGIINLASENNYTLREIADFILEASGNSIRCRIASNKVSSRDYVFDVSKRIKFLGKESVTLSQGVKKTIDWMKEEIY